MAINKATLTQVTAAYKQTYILAKALQAYQQGDAAPAGRTGSLTETQIDALITSTKTAIDAINSAA